MSKALAIAAAIVLLSACKQASVKVEPVRQIVVTKTPEPQRQRLPEWALQEQPEDAPRELSTQEAVALACRRLNIIRHANCLIGQLKRYDKGLKPEPSKCKLNTNEGCTP